MRNDYVTMWERTVDKQTLRNFIGSFMVQGGTQYDTLAIVLCSYFEQHMARPHPDPHTENGWGAWAEERANETLAALTAEVLRLTQSTR